LHIRFCYGDYDRGREFPDLSGRQEMVIISEPALYKLIATSRQHHD
jgi:prophage antirepressor-like protein